MFQPRRRNTSVLRRHNAQIISSTSMTKAKPPHLLKKRGRKPKQADGGFQFIGGVPTGFPSRLPEEDNCMVLHIFPAAKLPCTTITLLYKSAMLTLMMIVNDEAYT